MTTTQQLLDMRLPGGLEAYVRERREAKSSWEAIAQQIHADTDRSVAVTGNTLRRWFADRVA